jgi:hypothetical protein
MNSQRFFTIHLVFHDCYDTITIRLFHWECTMKKPANADLYLEQLQEITARFNSMIADGSFYRQPFFKRLG